MSAKISIIIPAYNTEKTVERTVRSVLASTIPLDVWVVDDGSTDGTGAVLDSLVQENVTSLRGVEDNAPYQGKSVFRVVHQENCGAYQARLNALKRITTPYFGFVDADDTVEPDMFEKMVDCIERNQLDCVQCKIVGDSSSSGTMDSTKILEGESLLRHKFHYLVDAKESCFIWDKVYRNQYDFSKFEPTDKVTNFDDMIFNFQFFAKIRRMGFLNEGLYHYNQTPGSAVHNFGLRQKHDFKWMVQNHWRLTKELFPNGEHSKLKLWIGHRKWFWRNLRNAMITAVRARMDK